jgi:hypothetical protein
MKPFTESSILLPKLLLPYAVLVETVWLNHKKFFGSPAGSAFLQKEPLTFLRAALSYLFNHLAGFMRAKPAASAHKSEAP